MRLKQREWHELPNTESVKAGTIRLAGLFRRANNISPEEEKQSLGATDGKSWQLMTVNLLLGDKNKGWCEDCLAS